MNQQQKGDKFHRRTLVNAQSIRSSEKYPAAGINSKYAFDNNSRAI